jgi:Family of unknown function (DUF5681)
MDNESNPLSNPSSDEGKGLNRDAPASTTESKKRGLPEEAKPFMWQPGQSGNPAGRAKKKPITELYEEILNDPALKIQLKQAIVSRLTSNRIVGSMELKEAAERVEGKVVQKIDADVTISTIAERLREAQERREAREKGSSE